MGKIFSRNKRTKTLSDELENIEEEIKCIEENQKSTIESQKNVVFWIIMYALLLYALAGVVVYSFSLTKNVLYMSLLLLYPFGVYFFLKFVKWGYKQHISREKEKLIELRGKKKKLLEEVMDKETFKVAKEILEKYAPDQLQKHLPEQLSKSPPKLSATPAKLAAPGSELRSREAQSQMGMRPPGPPGSARVGMETPRPGLYPAVPQRRLVRPLLSQNRSYVDKVLEFIVGDGPSNRYALICANCASHNGMALKEDFEFLAFRCAYCGYPNPSKKVRPRRALSQSPNRTQIVQKLEEPTNSEEETLPNPEKGTPIEGGPEESEEKSDNISENREIETDEIKSEPEIIPEIQPEEPAKHSETGAQNEQIEASS